MSHLETKELPINVGYTTSSIPHCNPDNPVTGCEGALTAWNAEDARLVPSLTLEFQNSFQASNYKSFCTHAAHSLWHALTGSLCLLGSYQILKLPSLMPHIVSRNLRSVTILCISKFEMSSLSKFFCGFSKKDKNPSLRDECTEVHDPGVGIWAGPSTNHLGRVRTDAHD